MVLEAGNGLLGGGGHGVEAKEEGGGAVARRKAGGIVETTAARDRSNGGVADSFFPIKQDSLAGAWWGNHTAPLLILSPFGRRGSIT